MNSKHAFLALSVFTLVSIAHGEREVFAPTKLAPTATAGTIQFGDGTAAAPSMTFASDPDTGVYRFQSNVLGFATGGSVRAMIDNSRRLIMGNGTDSSSPSGGSVTTTSGNGTDIAGASLTIAGGNSTGTAAGGALIFQTAAAGGVSGTTANTLTERMRITSDGNVFIGNGETAASVANGAIRATGGSGTNIAGADLLLNGGRSTGNATGGSVRLFTSSPGSSGSSINGSIERMRIDSTGDVVVGSGEGTGATVAGIVRGANAAGSNQIGAHLNLYGGRGTGSATGGSVRLWTAPAGGAGSSLNTLVERVRVKQGGQVNFIPLSADPTLDVENGDVYYNSTTNKLRVRAAGAWVDLH